MLKIHFINVADGDAILLEHSYEEKTRYILIDTGRSVLQDDPLSKRMLAVDYLKRADVMRLEGLIITHLHLDHSAGLENILNAGIAVDNIYASFFPPADADDIMADSACVKTIRNLIGSLNIYHQNCKRLRQSGCAFVEVTDTRDFFFEDLHIKIICTDPLANKAQNSIFSDLFYQNIAVDADDVYAAAAARNPNSLRVRITYRGKIIELAGDSYGSLWENEKLDRCDIFKLPHHGDQKSITPTIAEKLYPRYAVISCQRAYMPEKDRPSLQMAQMLLSRGCKVYFTDSFGAPWNDAVCDWDACVFTITDNGDIVAP
ncbi:MAG: MBL fold metallo-hydrolase [Clostridiaceae bacterium]|jgi:competence protein ComEC|nr:MBL fold metallo-hydrolase [Clostridiaceae bacterium]